MKKRSDKRPPLDLEIKLKDYKKKGEKADPRVIFSAGVPQFFRTAKDESYGSTPLYDDMTEKDVVQIFRAHKKERQAFLAQFGNPKRKYITGKTDRDHVWAQMAKRYKHKSFTKLASQWAKIYPDKAMVLFAIYLWSNPSAIESPELQDLKSGRSKTEFLDYFSGMKPTNQLIKDDFDEYIHNRLPKVIRPAVLRYKPNSK